MRDLAASTVPAAPAPKAAVSPAAFGAVGDGRADDRAALQAALDHCAAQGGELVLEGNYRCLGGLVVNGPVALRGRSRETSVLCLDIDNTVPGIRILASDVSLRDCTVLCNLSADVLPNRGDRGSCVTIGDFVTARAQPAISRVRLENVALTRGDRTQSGHGLVIIGRVQDVACTDLRVLGGRDGAIHHSAVLAHWGYWGASDDKGVPMLINETYHPNRIVIRSLTTGESQRSLYLSSVYDVEVTGIRQQGGSHVVNLAVGDEGASFARAEARGKVGTGILVRDVVARGLAGTGSDANMLEVTGHGRSKIRINEELPGEMAKNQLVYKRVVFQNWDVSGDPATVGAVNIRNCVGDIVLQDWKCLDADRTRAGVIANCTGNVALKNAVLHGELNVIDSRGVSVADATLDARSAAPGCNCLSVKGRRYAGRLAVPLAAGATTLRLADVLLNDGSTGVGEAGTTSGGNIKVGDVVTYVVGGRTCQVQATAYCEEKRRIVAVTPAPVAAPAGTPVFLIKHSEVHLLRCKTVDGHNGIEAWGAELTLDDSLIGGFALRGLQINKAANALATRVVFAGGGLGRRADPGLATRDVQVQDGGRFAGRELTFGKDAVLIEYNFGASAGALGGVLADCRFLGRPLRGPLRLAGAAASVFSVLGCTDAAGAAVAP